MPTHPTAGPATDRPLARVALEDAILRLLAARTGLPAEGLDPTTPFVDFGLTSRDAVVLVGELQTEWGRDLSPALLWEHPTARALSEHLAGDGERPGPTEPVAQPATESAPELGPGRDSAHEPVAVVGIGCRFPGADGPAEFWEQLAAGADLVGGPDVRRDLLGPHGPLGLLRNVEEFDAEFFSVSGREAAYLDPQQRLLLETSWEALENAGIAPRSLEGTDTGVFVGISSSDYGRLQGGGAGVLGPHSGSGQALTMAANRVSYVLGLAGPSLAVDTACSSSLVAVHLACRSLRSGESTTALAGGVNLILTPDATEIFTQAGMMAADGRCKTFDARADGYVRAEGCGVVVLKRLAEARRDGDPVLAVIRGSAVNQDGRSNGLTAPNGAAQERVIRAALRDAGTAHSDVGYVEAHGTGTPLGDPIETRALSRVLADGRPAGAPLLIGSVKTNIGHAEAAAGVAGLIKTVLALRHELIPPHLHLREPNPALGSARPFAVPTTPTPWPARPGTPRTAGVSSFGFGGTNAHVVVAEASAEEPAQDARRDGPSVHVLPLSARSPAALRHLVGRYADVLRDPRGPDLGELCHTAATGRTHFARRIALTAASREQALERAASWLETGRAPGVRGGPGEEAAAASRPGTAPVAFLFGGQGTEYPRMGRRLYETSPVFRREIDRFDEIAAAHLGRTVSSVLFPVGGRASRDSGPRTADRGLLGRTRWTQPALFAVEYALAQTWRSFGVEPDYLLGHSVGALAAACVAGVLGPEDGLRLAAARGRLVEELCAPGRMMLALAEEAVVREVLRPLQHRWTVVVAAVNGERNTVISGEPDGVDAARHAFAARGVPTHDLAASYAFHSPMTAPARAAVRETARSLDLAPPRIPLVSDVDGRLFGADLRCDAAHWARHLEEPVRFADGVRTLAAQGCSTFLEAGPGRVLSGAGRRTIPGGLWLTSLREGADDWSVVADSVAALYAAGHPVDWAGFHAGRASRRVPMLPTYPFERRRHWLPPGRPAVSAGDPAAPHRVPLEPRPEGPAAVENRHRGLPAQSVLAVLSGVLGRLLANEHAPDPDATFLELGADSVTLMHTLQHVQRTFQVGLPVARLFEEVNTLRLLADHIAAHAPQHVLTGLAEEQPAGAGTSAGTAAGGPPEPPAVTPPATPGGSAAPPATAVERFLSVHAHVMDQAYELLRGAGATATAAPSAALPAPPPAVRQEPAPTPVPVPVPAPAPVPRAAEDTFVAFRPAADGGSAPAGRTDGNPARSRYVAELVERYCARTAGSKAQAVRERAVHADVRHAPQPHLGLREARYPLVVERSRGSRLWDVDGNEYIDLTMGFGVNLFGHGEPFIEEALTAQLGRGMHIGPHNTLAADTAELVRELTGHERTVFCNTGSEAVMVAVRLARAVTGRSKVALFAGAYHGSADPVLAMQNPDVTAGDAVPLAPGVPDEVAANALVLPYDDPASLTALRDHAHELAAVLVEPVQSRRPDVQPGALLRELRELTRQAGIPLVLDEVITGFRTHPGGAQAHFGVHADMAVYGKVMGGGMPIGAVAGSAAYLDAIDGGAWSFGDTPYRHSVRTFFTGTFCKHPLALAAGRAVLSELKRRGPALQEDLNARVAALAAAVNDLFEGADVPVRLTCFGSLFRFRFLRETTLSETVEVFHTALADKGIYVWEGRNCFLSTAHTEEDVAAVVAALAETADEMTEAGFFPGARTIRPPAAMPPGDAQHELWLLAQMDERLSRAYNESVQLDLRGRLDTEALRHAVRAVVARHESLRTVFSADEGTQSVLPAGEFDVPVVEFADSEQDAAAWADRPFDLEQGPPVRAAVERLADDHHRLHLTAHHTVVDGWAFGVVLDEIGRLYAAALGVAVEPLPPARQFREHVQRQADRRGGGQWEADERFWLDAFCDGVPELRLPTDRPRPARTTSAGATLAVDLDGDLAERIRTAGSRLGCTPFALLLSAYAGLLHGLTGQDDLVIGVPVAQREQAGADRIVGDCSSVLPIRSRPGKGATAKDFAGSVQGALVAALRHGDYPFSLLGSRLPDREATQGRPLHGTLFNLDQAPEPPELPGLEVSLRTPRRRHVKCDLSIDVLQVGDRYRVTFEYSTELFDTATVRHYAGLYRDLLDGFLTDPDGPVHRLDPRPALPDERPAVAGEDPAVADERPAGQPGDRAPRDDREAALLGIWQEVTGSQDATVDDDFFALGGHSLQGTRVAAEVRARLNVTMPVRWLFENPTVAGLAARLAADDDTTPALGGRGERPDVVPLSFAQQRLWFLGKLEGPNPTYNLPLPLRLTGDLDTEALATALNDVVGRHEPLRTLFTEHKGVPRQHVLPAAEAPLTPAKRRTEAAELQPAMREAAAHPFDLSREIPVRAALFEVAERDHVLLVVLHHSAGDGWSLPVLARDLATAYAARRQGERPGWAPLPVQYADYTLWQAAGLGSEKDPESLAARQLAFWRRTLAGLPHELPLPTDRPRPAVATYRGGQVAFTVDPAVHTALGRLAQESRASVFMVVQAALAVLLDRLGAGTDIPLGTPVAGRTDDSLNSLVGFFVNTLVLRTDTAGDPTFRQLVERVRDADLAAFSHQELPFETLVRALNPPRVRSRHPLFQVMLGFETDGPLRLETAGLQITAEPDPTDFAKFDLFLSVRESTAGDDGFGGLACCLEYSTDLFDRATAETLAGRLVHVLTTLCTDPDMRCAAVTLPGELAEDTDK